MQHYLKIIICYFTLVCAALFAAETQSIGNPIGANFPKDAEGRVYHLGLKKGQIANNILLT